MESGKEALPGEEHRENVMRTVANVTEPAISAGSAGLAIYTVARALAGDIPVLGPVVGVAISSLVPILIAAIERQRERRSERVMRAHSFADAAWNSVTAARTAIPKAE